MTGFDRIARRPARVVFAVAVVTALAALPVLQVRLRTDLASLLPDGSPAADDYRVYLERFGGLERVFVLVLPDAAGKADEGDLIRAAGLLEELLEASPEVASARAGIDEDDEAFLARYVAPRAPLLLPGDWRGAVRSRLEPAAIRERVARLKASLSTPTGAPRLAFAKGDPLGFSELLPTLTGGAAVPLDLLSSTFLAASGHAALVIVTPARSEMDPEGGRALEAELAATYVQVRRELGLELELRAVGGPLYAAQDERLLRRDLERTLVGSLVSTAALLVVAFEGLLLPLVAFAPLLAALAWTAGWIGLTRSAVSAASVGFAAVLVGLGIDYAIHGAARFRESFLNLRDGAAALAATVRASGPGILTSALTTAAGFAVLGFAHLRPLREVGQLVAAGILAILAAMALLGSAILVLAAPRLRPAGRVWQGLGRTVTALSHVSARRAWLVLVLAALLTVTALWGLGGLELDPDPRTLRPTDHPALETEVLLAEHFGLGTDTANVVVHGRDVGEALARAARAGELLRRELGRDLHVSNPADLLAVGRQVSGRLRELGGMPFLQAADTLEEELACANLDPRAFAWGLAALRSLGLGKDPGAPPPQAWPDWLEESLAVDDDGAWVALSLRLPAQTWPQGPPRELVMRLREDVPGTAFASAVAIGTELRRLAVRDMRTLGLLALLAIAGVVVASFRGRWRPSLLAMVPVMLGAVWTLGIAALLGRSIDLFALAVLPILLGIGIDDGLHVLHGAMGETAASPAPIRDAVASAGRAILLTTLTTCAGFGSLALSQIPGLRNGGLLIAAGVAACFLATVMVLPALESVARRTR